MQPLVPRSKSDQRWHLRQPSVWRESDRSDRSLWNFGDNFELALQIRSNLDEYHRARVGRMCNSSRSICEGNDDFASLRLQVLTGHCFLQALQKCLHLPAAVSGIEQQLSSNNLTSTRKLGMSSPLKLPRRLLARPQPIPLSRGALAHLNRANLPRSRVEYERVVLAMVGTRATTQTPFSETPSLSAVKSRARTHTDCETHHKVLEVGAAFTGNLCPLTLRGAWFSHEYTARSHKYLARVEACSSRVGPQVLSKEARAGCKANPISGPMRQFPRTPIENEVIDPARTVEVGKTRSQGRCLQT